MQKHIIRNIALGAALLTGSVALTGCLGEKEEDYSGWKEENNAYVASLENEVNEDGSKKYEKHVPVWEPGVFVLMQWHNDRSKTLLNLSPLDNSTVNVKYDLELIDGTKIDDSYSMTTYGDSIYRTRPCNNIVGFWAALRQMHVGDSVTCIIPSNAGYGSTAYGSIKPYSTLVYHMKLKSIQAFEVPK